MFTRFKIQRCSAAAFVFVFLSVGIVAAVPPNERERKVRADKEQLADDESWVYNDWDKAVAEAKRAGKPLLVVLRCIPCEACSEFDDQVVRRDPAVRALMDQFVCVRIITTNGLDLKLFQFDYDQSFHAFLMHPDGTIYGRFGTRSESKDETQDMTMQGFARALELALAWHKDYPSNIAKFTAKQGPAPLVRHPEEFPTLKTKYTSELNYAGNVVQSCIHCHQIREAERVWYRERGESIPEQVLYPYPLPKVVGLAMNALEAAEVKSVAEESFAEKAGFQAGDRVVTLGGQPVLSIADLQWVLHTFGNSGGLPARVQRGEKTVELVLELPADWRSRSDISWRATSWDLRRMADGGISFEDLAADERASLGLSDDVLSLRAKHVGEYGDHAAAKRAGFQKGDILVEYDGSRARMSETQLLARGVNEYRRGDKIPVKVRRGDREIALQMPVQ